MLGEEGYGSILGRQRVAGGAEKTVLRHPGEKIAHGDGQKLSRFCPRRTEGAHVLHRIDRDCCRPVVGRQDSQHLFAHLCLEGKQGGRTQEENLFMLH